MPHLEVTPDTTIDSIMTASPLKPSQSDSETLLGIGGPWRGS